MNHPIAYLWVMDHCLYRSTCCSPMCLVSVGSGFCQAIFYFKCTLHFFEVHRRSDTVASTLMYFVFAWKTRFLVRYIMLCRHHYCCCCCHRHYYCCLHRRALTPAYSLARALSPSLSLPNPIIHLIIILIATYKMLHLMLLVYAPQPKPSRCCSRPWC